MDVFITSDEIIVEAGFGENPHIYSSSATDAALSANSKVNQSVGELYILPLSNNNTLYIGSPGEDFLKHLAKILGAAYMYLKGHAASMGDIVNMARSRIEYAEYNLKMIREENILLIDTDGNQLKKRSDIVSPAAYNSETVEKYNKGSTPERICMNFKF